MNFTLSQLRYVVALDTHRHFVSAAEACFVTQPTLTMQVKKLEEEMGLLLFDRKKHPLEPTPAGQPFIAQAREILRLSEQLQNSVTEERDSLEGEFKLGIIPTLAPYLLPLFLEPFTKAYPNVHLIIREMQSERIIDDLKTDTIDMGLLVTPLDESELREFPLFYEPFLAYFSANHPLADLAEMTPDDLTADDLWLLNQGHCFRNQVLNLCKDRPDANQHRGFSYESGSIETLKRMVSRHSGYTLVPELSLFETPADTHVRRFMEPQPVREVSLVAHHTFPRRKLVEVLGSTIVSAVPNDLQPTDRRRIRWR